MDRKHSREVINEIIRIFQVVENFMENQVRKENRRTHYTSSCKDKIMTIRSAMGDNERAVNFFIFYFIKMLIYLDFQSSSYLANLPKITKGRRNKIDAMPVLSKSRVFRRKEFNFINRFKGDFQAKL